jgi:type I restriction-modification system DNA methylase subunit
MSLFYEPNRVEIATGENANVPALSVWNRETKHLGQVETPTRIARLMARWTTSAQPRNILDPAAGLGALLRACHEMDSDAELVGIERDVATLQQAKKLAPRGAKLVLADYLKSDVGQFEGIIANPPYVKAHRLDYGPGDWRYFEELLGTPLDRLTNSNAAKAWLACANVSSSEETQKSTLGRFDAEKIRRSGRLPHVRSSS